MSRKTRKIIVAVVAVIVVILMSFTVRKAIQYDKGSSENYALDKQAEKQKNGILIFCYHRILKDNLGVNISRTLSTNSQLHDFNVPTNEFNEQMEFLHKKHIKVISGQEMVKMTNAHKPIKGKYAVLSFDDIDRTTIDNAIPVMKKYKFPFTTFIITGNTGRYREGTQLATWNQIKDAKKSAGNLMTIGLHTNNMHYLTSKLVPVFNLPHNYHRFTKDFKKSREELYKHTGSYGDAFAYPYGGGTHQTNDFLHTQHLGWVATLDGGVIYNHGNGDHLDLQYAPRMIINSNSWPSIRHWYSTK
ncbi:polysaccharide deacetylase [Apilactobacillus micheneri]|uniref:Polysaccharide deacetylase n=1 Tax=Apilactobacillus micheneri TaxID=1899430 RepID=A0ABY2YXS6_9LACO|nr:polysaccharide deacetylase family protein [Apilactobacillus micheneri]TPR26123.1 polysaccharide deacetylase [Apilactobacillus micheneri]TPR26877.1 polysaccharide deacetylase [Apilactobacillus micheneri]TPR27735.1 polysaccharide deacetylase [Apilactobacillus micheneri]TPR31640.1 polysaccharide deacetylase [Apilactobacillus micheneri]TPR32044.1 polysaccharide deacetylase [Apilactobacillus micheneri]